MCLLFLALAQPVQASHIRAAEIRIERLPRVGLWYRFTVIAIRDTEGIKFGDQGVFDFGDGSTIEGPFDPPDGNLIETPIGDPEDNLALVVFSFEHEYFFESFVYKVSYTEKNRNANILNMNNSLETQFLVEASFDTDPLIGGDNRSPVLSTLPIDFAASGVKFIHNPGAFDPDGDSLSYELVIPKQSKEGNNVIDVFGYVYPNDTRFYENYNEGAQDGGPPTFSIDQFGNLVWDAPGTLGEYNMAFRITEWRKFGDLYLPIGFTVRDMQVIVVETDNEPPELIVPEDICVIAGDIISEEIRATDPDGDRIFIQGFGEPFDTITFPRATLTPLEILDDPAVVNFEWETNCNTISAKPYQALFKATDFQREPDDEDRFFVNLVDFETWFIEVIAPAPTGLVAESVMNQRKINLSWDSYECARKPDEDMMQIWRRVDSFDIMLNDCEVGMPDNTGYELIDEVPITTTNFVDTELAPGAVYCYRLVARLDLRPEVLSIVSEEACDSIISNGPIITNVDINRTSEANGEIFVKWEPPFDLDSADFDAPFTYDVYRSTGFTGDENRTLVATTNGSSIEDIAPELNTTELVYNYEIIMRDGEFVIDSSATASSVRLEINPQVAALNLSWDAVVPWSNIAQDYPYHYIYRDRVANDPTQLVLIDSVMVSENGFTYKDDGSFNGVELSDQLEYCYYINTQGVYGNAEIDEPFINRSQVNCAQPNDSIPPCRPISFSVNEDFSCEDQLAGRDCDFNDFRNTLKWNFDQSAICDDDVAYVKIYFSRDGTDDGYFLLDSISENDTSYVHHVSSLKGCYRIATVDRSGNESALTDPICNDNCPRYDLPNAFSPNGDNSNDEFTPFTLDFEQCPRFVESVIFRVFDRTGIELYTYKSLSQPENDIYIHWDGRSNIGVKLPAGTYFYSAEVTFDVLDESKRNEVFKGYIQLMR